MNTFKVGNKSLLEVIKYFLALGSCVSLPFGDGGKYDLIVDDGKKLLRVEVKTGRLKKRVTKSVVIYNTASHQKEKEIDSRKFVDEFAIFCPQTNGIYIVSAKNAAKGRGSITV